MGKFCTLFLHGNQGLSESSWGEAGHGGTQSPASSPPVSNSFPTRSHMPKDRRGEDTLLFRKVTMSILELESVMQMAVVLCSLGIYNVQIFLDSIFP